MPRNRGLIVWVAILVAVPGFLATATPASAAWKEKVLHNFNDSRKDGYNPVGGLVSATAGRFYGTTESGGDSGFGTVFVVMPEEKGTWTEKVVHSFSGSPNGVYPEGRLVIDPDGNLYGATAYGGEYGDGTVFELRPAAGGRWNEKVLHSFNGSDGAAPGGGLVLDAAGNLYGTTTSGGLGCDGYGCGVVFRLTHDPDGHWKEVVLHKFSGKDGALPEGDLVFDAAGDLYGTTYGNFFRGCSSYDCGTVFKLTPSANGQWNEEVLHRFKDNGKDGYFPSGGVVLDSRGGLYGTTSAGGGSACYGNGCGTVFRLTHGANRKWVETLLHIFDNNNNDGTDPVGPLTFDRGRNLYGTTYSGGSHSYGTVFRLSRCRKEKWTEKILYNFCSAYGCMDGTHPEGGLIFDAAGDLYGTAFGGLSDSRLNFYPRGNVFELAP
jgi:uncharacterized repeat protein (TIGR03803 family)